MGVLWTLLIGLIVGALAKLVMPGKDPGGMIITIALGIVGSWVGTYLGRMLGFYEEGAAAGWIHVGNRGGNPPIRISLFQTLGCVVFKSLGLPGHPSVQELPFMKLYFSLLLHPLPSLGQV